MNYGANSETGQALASGSRNKVMPLAVTLVVLIQKPRSHSEIRRLDGKPQSGPRVKLPLESRNLDCGFEQLQRLHLPLIPSISTSPCLFNQVAPKSIL